MTSLGTTCACPEVSTTNLDEGAEEGPLVGADVECLVDLLELCDGGIAVALRHVSLHDEAVQGLFLP